MSSLTDLIPSLLDKTKQKKLSWKALDTESFTADVGPYTILVGKSADRITVFLTDQVAAILEESELVPSAPQYPAAAALYELAERQALVSDPIEGFRQALETLT